MYGDCMRLNEGLNDAAIFFSYEVTSSEWCCPLQRLSYLFGCIYNTTGKTIRCDCRSGNNKYKCWPAGSQVKKLIFYYSL